MVAIDQQFNQYIFTASNIDDLLLTQLNRALLLNERKSVNVKVVFVDYDREYYEKLATLEDEYDVDLQSIFVNMYDFFGGHDGQVDEELPNQTLGKPDLSKDYKSYEIKTEDGNENSYLFFKNDVLVKKQTFDAEGVLNYVRYYTNESISKIEEYDHLGTLIKSSVLEGDVVKCENYYRKDGTCYLIKKKRLNFEDELETYQILLINENNMSVHEFKNEIGLWNYFLKLVIDGIPTLLTSDRINHYHLIQNYIDANVYKAYFIHNFDQSNDFEMDEILGIGIEDLKKIKFPDALVYSTKAQKEDFIRAYGNRGNVFSLPPLETVKGSTLALLENLYEKNKVVTTLCDKDVIELEVVIRAFRIVADEVPESELVISGVHMLSDDIIDLIKVLNLGGNIVIDYNGNDMNQIYSSSAGSIFIKERANSELKMIQSLMNRCPVISYNFNYEVNEIINDGENGYLVKNGSVRHLADAIIELLRNPDMDKMRENSRLMSKRYSDTSFLNSWDSFLSNIKKKK